jgi:hypothetical protein
VTATKMPKGDDFHMGKSLESTIIGNRHIQMQEKKKSMATSLPK